MKKTFLLTIFILTIAIFFGFSKVFIFAEESEQSNETNGTGVINKEIKQINSEIQNRKNKIQSVKNKQKAYSEAIKQKNKEKATLNNQLAILENRFAKAELDIEEVQLDIEKINLEIKKTDISIKNKNTEIALEKLKIENILKILYKQDNVDTLEVFLLNNSFSSFLNQIKYLEDVNEEVNRSLGNLENFKKELKIENTKLSEKNEKLLALKKNLLAKKENLESEQDNKSYLLQEVNSSEKEYQRLLAETKKEQQDASNEIANLEKLVRAKVAKLEGKKLDFNDSGMIWPVPKNTITAYFHDPDYPFRYIFEHPAIDIRASQGTPLKAVASGYVARAKNGGIGGYSYIMIIHGDGLSSVYGHPSKILVNEDDYVVQGQTIGYSGGLPGTPGAGRLTTGPHLHFEVRKDGIPVDPLGYLP